MAFSSLQTIFQVFLIILCLKSIITQEDEGMQTYIVRVQEPNNTFFMQNLENWYKSFLPQSCESCEGSRPLIIYSFRHVMCGFVAHLSASHVKQMKSKPGFISARPDKMYYLQTTRSPKFLGLKENSQPWEQFNYGKGIIIGMLDSGISPKHQSFNDEGMPYPPRRWRGRCEDGINCNKKLIGARSFIPGYSAIDVHGHGTHTSSIAAGNFVANANFHGQAIGKSVGMAPGAHVAMYNVCNSEVCHGSIVMRGIDQATEDGVDVISISIASTNTHSSAFYDDEIAIATFGAVRKGIFVSCAGGNLGPGEGLVSNGAPWILTVAASTIDRNFTATVVLGNKQEFDGEMINQPKDFPSKQFPLVFLESCQHKLLEGETNFEGKIVVCLSNQFEDDQETGKIVRHAGGVGMILINRKSHGYSTEDSVYDIPTSKVDHNTGRKIMEYTSSDKNPSASLVFKGTILGVEEAPMVAQFSSRGPNIPSPGILKPDITGPGANILAAWMKSKDGLTQDDVAFNITSGTSMACPHLSGVAALLKSYHPDWSPAAIKSAIMTTAYTEGLDGNPIMDERKEPANLLALGSGHVNPEKAVDPGLIYDIHPDDYIRYLCGLYPLEKVKDIVGGNFQCPPLNVIPEEQLNYPSFSVKIGPYKKTYSRFVTNVGEAISSYELTVENSSQNDINVSPTKLVFSEVNQRLQYTVTFSNSRHSSISYSTSGEAAIIWSDGKHVVRSPIYFRR